METSQAGDIAAIRRIVEEWDAAWRAGNVSALAALFTEDAILMPQSQPAVIGRQAILSLYQSAFDQYTFAGAGEVLEVEVAGDWAFFRSTYTLAATARAGGEPIEDSGKWLSILKRQSDGSWRIARLIANSDRPAPGV